jgi:ankyrin repeat protein
MAMHQEELIIFRKRLITCIYKNNIKQVYYLLNKTFNDTYQNIFRESLFLATSLNRLEILKLLLQTNISINTTDENNNTILMIASKKGFTQIIFYLITLSDINLFTQNKVHETAFTLSKDVYIAKRILEYKINLKTDIINHRSYNNQTLLMKTVLDDNIDMFTFLVNFDADLTLKDEFNQSPFYLACTYNRYEFVKIMVNSNKIDINEKFILTLRVTYPILIAISNNYENIVDLFLENKDLNLNIINNEGQSCLHLCANKLKMQQKLLNNPNAIKYNLNKRDNDGSTPLLHAIDRDDITYVEMLLKVDADITICNYKRLRSPIYASYINNNIGMFKLLLCNIKNNNFNFKKLLTIKDSNKKNIYDNIIECFNNTTDITYLNMLNKYTQNTFFCTKSILAVLSNDLDEAKKVINNTNINDVDSSGNTALYYSISSHISNVIQEYLLTFKNVNLYSVNNNNESIFDIATKHDNVYHLFKKIHTDATNNNNITSCKVLLKYLNRDVLDNIILKYL